MKIRIIPKVRQLGTENWTFDPMYSASFKNVSTSISTGFDSAHAQQVQDYKEYRGLGCKRYYKIGKYNRSIGMNWMSSDGVLNEYPVTLDYQTAFFGEGNANGFANPPAVGDTVNLGRIEFTYYIELRSRYIS